ncbi:unnamed protein product [Lymnaea stagnalis]|uniref:Uncharacterized protein n=1 Tax=Lymnaea stagnalis TaxID=6523 RepID=A0AAV2HY61_LYMST
MADTNKKSGTSRTKAVVYENIFPNDYTELEDEGYEKLPQLMPVDVTSRLEAIERTQSEIYTEFKKFKQQMSAQLTSLMELTTSLQQTMLDTALKQERLDLTTQDHIHESADHLGAQLMDVTKDVKAIISDQRKLLSMTSRHVATTITTTTSRQDVRNESDKGSKTKVKGLPNL